MSLQHIKSLRDNINSRNKSIPRQMITKVPVFPITRGKVKFSNFKTSLAKTANK